VPSVRRYGSPKTARVPEAPIASASFWVQAKPVSSNATYRRGKGSGFYLTQEAKAYHDAVRLAATVYGCKPIEGPVDVELHFFFDSARPDIDGPIKGTLDALQGVCYANDRQVTRLVVLKSVDKERPRVAIKVQLEAPF
jgi:Holliday junction resolvase RusA-like endonuclease